MATPSAREKILEAAHDLVFEMGFTGTTVDAILEASGTSKGAFFHHFPTKGALGKALIERYAETDAEVLERQMTRAESLTADPAEQLVEFLRGFEHDIEAGLITQPGCLFASYLYERIPAEVDFDAVVLRAIALWRGRILEKLQQAVDASAAGGRRGPGVVGRPRVGGVRGRVRARSRRGRPDQAARPAPAPTRLLDTASRTRRLGSPSGGDTRELSCSG